jgi:hypothetical protein
LPWFLIQQETKLCGLEYYRGRVYKLRVYEAMWFHKLLTDLLDHEMDPMSRENPVFPDGSKYDEKKWPYFRDMMQRKIIHMQYLPTHEQIADIFTKLTS